MLQANNALELLNKLTTENLYPLVIQQINKDFNLSNVEENIGNNVSPIELKEHLYNILLKLISNNYDGYLNFLYRIDVAETDMLKITATDLPSIVNSVTLLVLKRECSKVWLKHNFK
jgi:hypothetical protein